jgi:zona occludens toxin
VLVCQKHDQIDSFVKGLIDPHIHVRRKFGFNVALLKTWDRFESNCAKGTDYIIAPTWRYPKEVFGLYTSATMHTVKKKLPWYFFAPFVLAPIVVGAIWYAKHSLQAMGEPGGGAVGRGRAARPRASQRTAQQPRMTTTICVGAISRHGSSLA